jgi:hypothetical protein
MSILLDDCLIWTGTLAFHRMILIPVRLMDTFQGGMPDENLLLCMVIHASATPDTRNQCILECRLPASSAASSNQYP